MNVAGVARARGRLVLRAWLSGRGARRGPVGAIITVALGVVAYSAMALVFARLADDGAGPAEGARLLALVLTATLVGLLVLDLQDTVATLVADPDLELVRRAPVPGQALLLMKLADALPRTTLLIVALALPAVLAYATAWPIAVWAWPLVPLLLAALWALPLSAGAAAALALLACLPARRVREGLGLLATVTVTAVWVLNTLVLPRIGGTEPRLARGLDLARAPVLEALSPAHRLAAAVGAAAAGDPAGSLAATAILLGAAGAALLLAAWVARGLLDPVQARLAAGAAGERGPARRRGARPAAPRGVVKSVILRDARLFVRDWTVLGDVVTTAALWTLLPFVSAPVFDQPSGLVVRAMLLALIVGLGHEIAARMLPFERRGATWMRLAPVAPGRWLAGKLAGAALLAAPMLLVAATGVAVAFPVPALEWARMACLVIPAFALALATGLWTGAAFGDPEWTNPLAMIEFGGRIVGLGLLLAEALGWVGFALVSGVRGGLPGGADLWAPALIVAVLAPIPIAATRRRLERSE